MERKYFVSYLLAESLRKWAASCTSNGIKDTRPAFATRHLYKKTQRLQMLDPQMLMEQNTPGQLCDQAATRPCLRIGQMMCRIGQMMCRQELSRGYSQKQNSHWCVIKRPCNFPQPQFIFWLIVNHWRPHNYWLESGREEGGRRTGQLKFSSSRRIWWVDGLEWKKKGKEESALDSAC